MRTAPSVSVSSRGAQRIHGRHPWVYRSDVSRIDAAGGDTVRVLDARSRPLGMALYSERSQIALRMLTWGDQPAGLDLWRARIDRAVRYRETLGIDATAYRLVHGEGDLLPSLVVDRYGEHLVVQALSQGVDDRDTARRFVARHGISYDTLLDSDGRVARAYGVLGLPTTFFVDRTGRLNGKIIGESTPRCSSASSGRCCERRSELPARLHRGPVRGSSLPRDVYRARRWSFRAPGARPKGPAGRALSRRTRRHLRGARRRRRPARPRSRAERCLRQGPGPADDRRGSRGDRPRSGTAGSAAQLPTGR